MSSATYRTLLRAPGAAAFFLTAAVGRVGIAMTSLGIVWLVHARTGSYTTAGLVTGGFAVAEAVAGPQLARLIERFGQSRVLPPALLAHAAAVATLLALVAAGTPDWLMTAGGVLAGATIPQLGALSAARWVALLRDERAAALPTAFALESLANELAYLAGPALVSILGASGYPAAGTVLAATLVVAGGLCFAAQRRTAPPLHCSRYPVAPACWPAGCTGCASGAQLRGCNWRWPRPDWRSAACRCLWPARRLNWGSASR
jgi:MFS family permease